MSCDVTLPFLHAIEALILDRDVSEIMVNGGGRVFLERGGLLTEATNLHLEERNLEVAVRSIVLPSATTCRRSSRSSTHAFRTARALPP